MDDRMWWVFVTRLQKDYPATAECVYNQFKEKFYKPEAHLTREEQEGPMHPGRAHFS